LNIITKRKKVPELWEEILSHGIVNSDKLPEIQEFNRKDINLVSKTYPMFINQYYFNLNRLSLTKKRLNVIKAMQILWTKKIFPLCQG
jgi:hypothetical protein